MTPGIVAESDLTGALKSEYVFFNGERIARRDFGPTGPTGVFYYFSDHLKTASVITDSAGIIKSDSDYYPWGGELQFVANDANHYKFTGKERDTETGLDYFGARYYSNGLGRFITPDWAAKAAAVPYADFADPQSLNLYTYVRNVPTANVDTDGHRCEICAEIEQKIEEIPSDAKAVAATLAGVAKATTIDTILTGGGTALLAVPPVAATTFAATQNFEGPSDCSAAYCDMYASFGNSSQSQSQQGDSQQAEPEPEAQTSTSGAGAQKGGGTYKLVDPQTGRIMRTGQTNNLDRRQKEHARGAETKGLRFEVDKRSNNRAARRGREQILHETHRPPLNKRRPISPTNPNKARYMREGRKLGN